MRKNRISEVAPRKRCPEHDVMINAIASKLLKDANMQTEVPLFAVNQRRGHYNHKKGYIVIPIHAIKSPKPGYLVYYVAHELAHVFTPSTSTPHGGEFMDNLKKICPKPFQHYEYGYKPRNAARSRVETIRETNTYRKPKIYDLPYHTMSVLNAAGKESK